MHGFFLHAMAPDLPLEVFETNHKDEFAANGRKVDLCVDSLLNECRSRSRGEQA
jgi:hypothetical protein